VKRMIFENRFHSTTTPLIAAADEKEIHGVAKKRVHAKIAKDRTQRTQC
jgi:hypothetical protein